MRKTSDERRRYSEAIVYVRSKLPKNRELTFVRELIFPHFGCWGRKIKLQVEAMCWSGIRELDGTISICTKCKRFRWREELSL